MSYDYRAGKQRIKNILDTKLEIIKKDTIPNTDTLSYDDSYYGWIDAIFVDIRNSVGLFSDKDKVKVSKIIKCFTSEVIEILREGNKPLELGIRGDCVYAIYTGADKSDTDEIFTKGVYINTLMEMLDKMFVNKGYPEISVGIGISTAQELVILAGRKNTGINAIVWVGEAVSRASKLSGYGYKNGTKPIVISPLTYKNITKEDQKYFTPKTIDGNEVYHGNAIMIHFDNWVKGGMR